MKKKKLRLLPPLIVLFIALVVVIVFLTIKRGRKENQIVTLVSNNWILINQLNSLRNEFRNHDDAIAAYAYGSDKDDVSLVQSSAALILKKNDSVKSLLKNEPGLLNESDSLAKNINRRIDLSNQIISLGKAQGIKQAALYFLKSPNSTYSSQVFASAHQLEFALMQKLENDQQSNTNEIKRIGNILTVLRILLLILFFIIIRQFVIDFILSRRLGKQLKQYNLRLEKDVTEKTAEIRQSEERYRTLVEQASDAIIISDINAKVLDVNGNTCKMLGYSKEALCKMNIEDFVLYENEQQVRNVYELLARGNSILSERTFKCNNGSLIIVESKSQKLSDDRIMSIVRDITERKRMDEALKASEQKLKQVLSSSVDLFYVIDRNYRIILLNEIAENKLSIAWGRPVTIGTNILELIPGYSSEPVRESFEKVFNGEGVKYELKNSIENLPLWVSVTYSPVKDHDGAIVGAYVITEDISKRKKAEEELRQTVSRFELIGKTTNDAVWEWDIESGKLWANETHQQLYGLTSSDPVPTQEMWIARIHPDDKSIILKMQEQAIVSATNFYISEYRFNVEGRGYRNIFDRGYIVRDENGKAIRLMGSMMDITDQKKAEEELRKSEQRYRSLIEQASDFIMITDTTGNFKDVNSSLCKTFGYKREEFLAMNISDIIDPEQIKEDPIRFDMLMKGQTILRERRMMGRDGTIIEVEANVKMLPDGRVLAIARDIQERKKSERAIHAIEETRKLIMDSSLDAIVCIDTGGLITVWTPQSEKIFGWKENEVIGKRLSEFIIPLSQRERHEKGLKKYLKTGQGKVLNQLLEFNALKKDGIGFPVEVSIVPVKQEGREFFCGFIRDITERKKAEEEIKKAKELSDQIIDSLPGVFYLFNEAGNFIRWNKQFETVTGYDTSEIADMRPWEFFEGEEIEYIKDRIQEVFIHGSNDAEAHFVTKEKTRIPYYFRAVRINYENQTCLLGYGIDISDRKKAEKELEESFVAIRQLTDHLHNIREEERTHIAREIHDELGQQLTVLKMDASWLYKKLNDADENVKQKLKDLLELMDSTVKTVRRISSELRPSLLDDMGLVPAMEWHLKEFEKRTSLKTQFKAPSNELNLPDTIKTGLFRIFQESLTNVARHANAKKVEINLQLEKGNIVLNIKDDGKGFEMEKARAKKTLGILGMQERSFMMGGKYEVKSKPGKGTQIKISVPYPTNQ